MIIRLKIKVSDKYWTWLKWTRYLDSPHFLSLCSYYWRLRDILNFSEGEIILQFWTESFSVWISFQNQPCNSLLSSLWKQPSYHFSHYAIPTQNIEISNSKIWNIEAFLFHINSSRHNLIIRIVISARNLEYTFLIIF